MRSLRSVRLLVAAIVVLALSASFSSWPAAPVRAATTFTVNSTLDEPDLAPGDGECSVTPLRLCTLRGAILEANALPGPDTIVLPAGTYIIDNALAITSEITILGASARNTRISRTVVPAGGRAVSISRAGVVTMSGVTIMAGFTLQRPGGGIDNGGVLTLRESALVQNADPSSGGGLLNSGTANLERVLLHGNVACADAVAEPGSGGGIANTGTLSLRNVTLSGNRSCNAAGGIYNTGLADLENVTFADNSVSPIRRPPPPSGHSILNTGQLRMRNTVVFRQSGGNCLGLIESLGANIENGDTCALSGPNDLSHVDPRLAPLADNGGPTDTIGLLPDSPAMDRGQDAVCPPTDQRGAPRPRDGNVDGFVGCDSGAFEQQPSAKWLFCEPRPPVRVAVASHGVNTLLATVTAVDGADGAPNQVRTLRLGRVANATIEIEGQRGLGANQVVPFPGGRTQTTFLVRRGPQGDAATVVLEVVDDCGPWRTFVGGGRDAWGGSGSGSEAPKPAATPTATSTPASPPTGPTRRVSAPTP